MATNVLSRSAFAGGGGGNLESYSYVLQTDSGDEALLQFVDAEDVTLTAKAEDVRVGKVALTLDGTVEGTFEGIDTSDANASADDIKAGMTAYVNGEKIEGVHMCPTITELTEDATATAEDILLGKTAYANGIKLVGAYIEAGYALVRVILNDENYILPIGNVFEIYNSENILKGTFESDGIKASEDFMLPVDTYTIKCTAFNIVGYEFKDIVVEAYQNQLYEIPILVRGTTEIAISGDYIVADYMKNQNVDICLIGGGGAGGGANTSSYTCCGGGAGAYMTNELGVVLSSDILTVAIGAGGVPSIIDYTNGTGGGTTTLIDGETTYSANGGGVGGQGVNFQGKANGGSGGTGGGSGSNILNSDTNKGGNGGSNGGNGTKGSTSGTGVSFDAGVGDGLTKHLFADDTLPLYCGGGGGAAYSTGTAGVGGAGGGGNGANSSSTTNDTNATAYGGGGGGSYRYKAVAGAGYQGAIFIRIHEEVA